MITTQQGILKKETIVTLVGRGDIALHPSHHIATGGEGSIYKPSSKTIVKLYSDPYKMSTLDMQDKIQLLSRIKHPFIVSPKGVVLQGKKPIGYYMDFVDAEPLARVFTSTYRQRENFKDKDAIALVDGMRTTIEAAHQHNAIVVDANEFNWLVNRSNKIPEPRIIDVDSWAIGKWKASVIMPSIRDWHTHGFTRETDWFSFGIVSFQVFTGIHPYKGMLSGYTGNDMEKRMKDNKSVFTTGVRLNSAVRDFSCIPPNLLEWYEAVFQNGERSMPPSPLQQKKMQAIKHAPVLFTSGAGSIVFSLLYDGITDEAITIYPSGVMRLASGTLRHVATGMIWKTCIEYTAEVIPVESGYLLAELVPGENIRFTLLVGHGGITELQSHLKGKSLLRFQDRLFVVTDAGLTEITVKDFGKPILVTVNTWQVLGNATTWYRGLGIQQSLGAVHLVVPFGTNACTYISAPSLKDQKVVDAVAGFRHIIVTALDPKSGRYSAYQYTFNSSYTDYQVDIREVDTPELNVALLPKGVRASIIDDGKLMIAVPTNGQVREVLDPQVKSAFVLSNWQNKVIVTYQNKVWSMTMKP